MGTIKVTEIKQKFVLESKPGPEVIKLFSCSTQLSVNLNAHKYKSQEILLYFGSN